MDCILHRIIGKSSETICRGLIQRINRAVAKNLSYNPGILVAVTPIRTQLSYTSPAVRKYKHVQTCNNSHYLVCIFTTIRIFLKMKENISRVVKSRRFGSSSGSSSCGSPCSKIQRNNGFLFFPGTERAGKGVRVGDYVTAVGVGKFVDVDAALKAARYRIHLPRVATGNWSVRRYSS